MYLILLVWIRLISERKLSRFWYLCLEIFCESMKYKYTQIEFLLKFIEFRVFPFWVHTTYATHLADVLQIHRVYNHLIIIWHKLFVDRVVKRP